MHLYVCVSIYIHAFFYTAKEVVSVSCRHHSLKAFNKKKKKRRKKKSDEIKEKENKKKVKKREREKTQDRGIYGRGYLISPTVARQPTGKTRQSRKEEDSHTQQYESQNPRRRRNPLFKKNNNTGITKGTEKEKR